MKHSIYLLGPIVLGVVSFPPPTYAVQPTREAMESVQTDALGYRRGKKRGDEEWFEPMRLNRESASVEAPRVGASAPPVALESSMAADQALPFSAPARSSVPAATSGGVTGAGTRREGGAPDGIRGKSTSRPGSGIVTGLGVAPPGDGNRGRAADAYGHGRRSGIVTGAGSVNVPRHSGAIVTGAGVAAGAAPNRTPGAGIVTGAGTSVAPAIAAGGARPHGIATGAGGPPGHASARGGGRNGGKH